MMEVCRDRFGEFNSSVFTVYACAMCYQYLLRGERSARNVYSVIKNGYGAMTTKADVYYSDYLHQKEDIFYPDINNSTLFGKLCQALNPSDCSRWSACCLSANACCEKQLKEPPLLVANSSHEPPLIYCPRTWDGFSCFPDTLPSTSVVIQCPSYIKESYPQGFAEKLCTENGTWYVYPNTETEWTDYTACVGLQQYRQLFYVAVSCHTFSLILTLPAIFIFLVFRQLRRQDRIQIHVNLFLSFVLCNGLGVVWESVVFNDRLEQKFEDSFMYRHQYECRILNILTRYAVSTNFFWMCVEGIHLVRLIVNAFELNPNIAWYFVFGWTGPAVFFIFYVGFRFQNGHNGCWIETAEGLEWIIYAPILFILVVNILCLLSIIVTLTQQIHVHPNEPNSYRRALKAMCILIPLFGIQTVFIVYRPDYSPHAHEIEIAAKILSNSQGGLVALLFCYLNKEVRNQIQFSASRCILTSRYNPTTTLHSRNRHDHDQMHETHRT